MTKLETMEKLLQENNGYLLAALVQQAGISRTYLSKFVKERGLERAEAGVYILPEIWPDPLYILQLKNKETVFSGETALYLQGLMEREPERISVAVKRGYNASHLIRRGIKPCFVRPELFDMGLSYVKTSYGNDVRVYDIDRTICDSVKHKDKMDVQVFQFALKEYMSGKRKNIHHLMQYAQQLGIEGKIREYTEVML